ncbi:MAG: helix-turn-helix domain-containing protein, partial [Bacteroidaceae bacterium]|nr:helix-turn-helix domain-containing protein [Bacteroidaceae bacterium]
MINDMKPQHALVVLLAMLLASGLASVGSYRSASRMVSHDMARALAITMQEQHSDVISQDTIRA